ncbi:inositol monophosphatase family protein [Sphingomicrobium astaxanthinifaciens]|uniref:inositol monophosphatase family protein n=1 Tax=Sphingomicrobium astaxanthinifaciens TaxID=1227949 RepID=UPI001FCBD782|nr:inositol monophosphatase family protein [Sphingomicrobium astaxanthinifaciens]MCJ7421214.1 histidinol phosphate phosphatase [Sphingomicrobium astaxanthinifaciens]
MDRVFFQLLSVHARRAIASVADRTPDNKDAAGFNPVTEADRAAERALREVIAARFPEHGIWGEEYGWSREGAAAHWSLDPIDGTRAFICGLPSWAVLVGHLEAGRHVAGMIDLPDLGETYVGIDGETRLNGARVRSSGCTVLAEARIATTDPYLFDADERPRFEALRRAARLTRFGMDAMAFAKVASGSLDLATDTGLKPHDYDALVAVVRGAGGHVGNWSGGSDLSGGDVIAAASEPLFEAAVRALET